MGYKYQADTMPSFYEAAESLVVEAGFNNRAAYISPGMVAFMEGIIEDVRSQGADPELVVNWLTAARSALLAMKNKKFGYKMYFGGPNAPGTSWNGYESYWNNGTFAMGADEALYNVGGGQWHHEMGFSDPFFGSAQNMVSTYNTNLGKNPPYDGAACMAAGIAVTFGLQKYGNSLTGMTVAQRREEIRLSVGTLNDETLYGMIRFNRFNQNNGRLTINWQVLEDGGTRPVLPAESAATQFRFPSPSWDARLGCPAGTYADGTLQVPTQCTPCQEGRFRSMPSTGLNFSECQQCDLGYGSLPGQTGLLECPACPAGRYQNGDSDRGVCNRCSLGTSRGANSSGGCSLCSAESYADELGLEECKPCPSRSSQGDLGQTFCFCDVGAYKDPTDTIPIGTVKACLDCETVIPGSTTLYPNSRYSHECVCPAGTYWHRPSSTSPVGVCKSCGLGLVCLGGREPGLSNNATTPPHQAPVQQRGYAAGAPSYEGGVPSFIVECNSVLTCPGSLELGKCPGSNSGIACVDCLPDHYQDNGVCYSCAATGFALWPLLIALVLAVIMLLGLYKFATKADKPHRDSMMTVTIGAGLALATLQALSAFSKVEVEWVEPLQTLRGIFAFLIFDISILRPGCFLGNTNPVLHYLGSLMVWPMVAGGIMVVFFIAKYMLKKEISFNEVIKAQGLIVSAVYIALTALAVRPFQCVGNPDGTSSMSNYRNIICWQDSAHSAMVGLSILPFFGGVCMFMALIIWAVIQYPFKVASPGGVKFVKRFNFIFSRFNPDAYYFALILNIRNFLIGILPVLLVSFNELQFLSLTMTVSIYALLQAHIWPWRTRLSNLMDACLALFLMVVIVVGSMLLEFDSSRGTQVIQVILMIGMILAAIGLVAAFSWATYRTYNPTRTYGIFLSHHKLGAAVLSRWFKMLLSEVTKSKIFLDSDDVSKLDAIIDVTAWDSENVVVLMTGETLKRMWCAAEIASAWAAQTNIVLVSCDGNGFSQSLIDTLPSLWTEEQQSTLANAGVNMRMIVESYQDLLKRSPIVLDRNGAKSGLHQDAVTEVVSQCKNLSRNLMASIKGGMQRSNSALSGAGSILMLGDLKTAEAGSCCRVIQMLLQKKLQEAVTVIDPQKASDNLDGCAQDMFDAKVILVILTQGVLTEPTFAGSVAACPEEVRGNFVPIKADENFVYPDPLFWEKLAEGKIFSKETLGNFYTDFEGVRAAYARLFNVLALKFTSHGSESIQGTEIQVMKGRLEPMLHESTVDKSSSVMVARMSTRKVTEETADNQEDVANVTKEIVETEVL